MKSTSDQVESPLSAPGSFSGPETIWSGVALVAGSVLLVAAMSHHPEARGVSSTPDFLRQVAGFAGASRWVHGVALISGVLITFGFLGLLRVADLTTPSRRWVGGCFLVGSVSGAVAGFLNGFLLSALADRYADASASEVRALEPVLGTLREAAQIVESWSVIGWSAAFALFAVIVLRQSHRAMPAWMAWLAGVLGLSLLTAVTFGWLETNVAGYTVFVGAQVLWFVCAGTWLIRHPKDVGAA